MNMYNCKVVTVSSSTFENNHAQSVFRDLPSRVPGGGLSITTNSSLTHSKSRRTFTYTIQDCTFSNNSANSTVDSADTTTLLSFAYINNRGGGVAIYVVHPSAVINISRCNFTNNFAPYLGGGLYMFSSEQITEEDYTVADNYFEGNEAKFGGGIALGTSSRKVKDDVILTRNTFLRNSASFGGAMFLVPGEL